MPSKGGTVAAEGRVVVLVSPKLYEHETQGAFAARILELGLTAYSDQRDMAMDKVKQMLTLAIQAHRERGDLAAWLSRSGVTWHWADDAPGDILTEPTSAPP